MKSIGTLEEFKERVEEQVDTGKLLFSHTESYPAGLTLGDEDSPGGSTLKMKTQLLLLSDKNIYYYEEDIEDEELYKEQLKDIDALKELISSEAVESEELDERIRNL